MEEAASLIVQYLYDNCIDPATGQRSCALVRFYKTHRYGALEPGLQRFAAGQLGDVVPGDETRLIEELGLDIESVVSGKSAAARSGAPRNYEVRLARSGPGRATRPDEPAAAHADS